MILIESRVIEEFLNLAISNFTEAMKSIKSNRFSSILSFRSYLDPGVILLEV